VAVEALLCEAPVIAFRSGGLTDIISDGETGILVTPGETQELATAMDRVITNPANTATMAAQGRRHALDSFSPDAAAEKYISIYKEAIARRAA